MHVDYLIVGQGISGTLLSRYLLRENKTVMIIDNGNPVTASKVASGVINPVTGKRLVRTWMIEELLPFALDAYTVIGNELGIELVQECDILDFHFTQDMSTAFSEKLKSEKEYLHNVPDDGKWSEYFRFNYGIGKVSPCLLLDIDLLLRTYREQLIDDDCLLEEVFNWEDCKVQKDSIV